jgi:hypothetical protein
LILFLACAVFLRLWGGVLLGSQTLIPEDILYRFAPFAASPGSHSPGQTLTSDVALLMFPWFKLVRSSLLAGHLPLWNPYAFGGSPLLANGQSAPFSIFTILALPFSPAYGMSLVMLARLVVAGTGTFLFLHQLGAGARAAVIGGVAFASSSFMVVWLGWPMTSVAAIVPFGFAAAERHHRTGSRRALAGLALVLGLQFLGGHIETSIHFAGALAIYALVRALSATSARRVRLAGLAAAGVVGVLLAAAALVPLFEEVQRSGIVGFRASTQFGQGHLQAQNLLNWLIPNRLGNPAIDGSDGPKPNYNEAVGFATVTALMLAPLGLAWLWRRARSAAAALVGIGLLAAGTVYGPLAPIVGRLPVLSVTLNTRMLVLLCFIVAVLGGLGAQQLEDRQRPRPGALAVGMLAIGAAAMVGLAVMAYLLFTRRSEVETMLPTIHYAGFWVTVAALSVIGATAMILAGAWRGASRPAVAGVAVLVIIEAAIFAGPYNPRVSPADVPPPSAAMRQLRLLASDRPVVALESSIPETLSLYQIHDEAGYDAVFPPRVSLYWSHADTHYHVPDDHHVVLSSPRLTWLAAAGVAYVEAAETTPLEGARTVSTVENVALQAVPDARPFAYVAPGLVRSRGADESVRLLASDPTGPVIVEGCCGSTPAGPDASLHAPVIALPLSRQGSERVAGDVVLSRDSLVVVGQTYTPDWVARVDGKQVPVHPANVMLQSVEVPAGRHHVELSYEPASVRLGLALSGFGVFGLMALLWLPLGFSRSRFPAVSR